MITATLSGIKHLLCLRIFWSGYSRDSLYLIHGVGPQRGRVELKAWAGIVLWLIHSVSGG
jgi:hypothetical protein